MVFFTLPQSTQWVALFLATLFIALELTIGTILYLIKARRSPPWLDKRAILREAIIITAPVALAGPLYLALRYATADTWYTVTLLLIFISFSEYQLIKKLN